MVQVIAAREAKITDLQTHVQLEEVTDRDFFPEWRGGTANLAHLTEGERQFLDKIRDGFVHLRAHPPLLEKAVQIAVLGPLLFLANCYLPPFYIHTEESIEITSQDGDLIVRGNIDILLLKDEIWVAAIESKKTEFSVEAGLSQLLVYMLANPRPDRPTYGLITTGGEYLFVKLVQGEINRYATSDQFVLRRQTNELYEVFGILQHLLRL
jgi:hypothetical protein